MADTLSQRQLREAGDAWWHPNRAVRLAPEGFRRRLKSIHPDLEVTWNPVRERWLVWYKRDRVRSTDGWLLLFPVENSAGEYVPLDDRTFAAIYERSAFQLSGASEYWSRIESEHQRQEEKHRKECRDLAGDAADERWDYTLIKNVGAGNKFLNHVHRD